MFLENSIISWQYITRNTLQKVKLWKSLGVLCSNLRVYNVNKYIFFCILFSQSSFSDLFLAKKKYIEESPSNQHSHINKLSLKVGILIHDYIMMLILKWIPPSKFQIQNMWMLFIYIIFSDMKSLKKKAIHCCMEQEKGSYFWSSYKLIVKPYACWMIELSQTWI